MPMRRWFRWLYAGNAVPEPGLLARLISKEAAVEAAPSRSAADLELEFHAFVLDGSLASGEGPSAREKITLKRLQEAFGGDRFDASELPRLPEVLPHLISSLRSDEIAVAALAKQIGRDPVLVGEVIRVANSTYYRTSRPIESLHQGIVLLGHDGLRKVVASAVLKPFYRLGTGGFSQPAGDRLWAHSERCAHACTVLGKASCAEFEAYLAGTVAHIGAIAVTRQLDRDPEAVHGTYSPAFLREYARLVRQLSLQIARYWKFPDTVLATLGERAQAIPATRAAPLTRALNAAELISMQSLIAPHERPALPEELPAHELGIAPGLLSVCAVDFQRRFGGEQVRPR